MEEKKINLHIEGPSPFRRIIKKPGFWGFIVCALIVFVCEAWAGDLISCIWIILAAVGYFFSDLFKAYSDDFLELSVDLAKELDVMQEVLKEKDDKIAELQTENISLRFGKTTKQ